MRTLRRHHLQTDKCVVNASFYQHVIKIVSIWRKELYIGKQDILLGIGMILFKARWLDTLLSKVLRQLTFHCVSRYDVRTSYKNFPIKKSTSTTTKRHFASRLIPSSTAASGFTETGGFETYLQEMCFVNSTLVLLISNRLRVIMRSSLNSKRC